MRMLLIEGDYRILNGEPDGDTVRFDPHDAAFWYDVPGSHRIDKSHRNSRGGANLRLDSIDALETHYLGTGPHQVHQPLDWAHAARDELLAWLGFTAVQLSGEKVTGTTPASVPGFVLASTIDVHSRCVALAGRGAPPAGTRSGDWVTVDAPLLRTTVNHHLLALGLVFPTFYANLSSGLRAEMTAAAAQADAAGLGVWAADRTTEGAKITGLSSITDDLVLLPKLFRRLADYLRFADGPSLDGFRAYLFGGGDRFRVLSQGPAAKTLTGLHHVVDVTDGTVRMTHPVTDLVFAEE
ncbi:nuclease [Streptomyces fagopyri]|uniref:Nuclease n=1 Tax=Streptomyces fagopyri TaxID=2662397 RepID=A0A5Q0LJG4_9ACTN|nr:nuclease [Streptomyces fagopyri]QFZ76609.1 nuclease [Streptomyces fagopyri]